MSTRFPSAIEGRTFLALSCIGSLLIPAAAHAQDVTTRDNGSLGGVTVTSSAVDETPGGEPASPKRTAPLIDTPQTVTVLSAEVLHQQNLLSLQDMLSTVPGITFGAGEGGGGYGDSINFRGYSANSDITVDGVRDSAQYTRTDSFNIEQLEVTNGANSVVVGSGSVGGSINIVTKRPLSENQAVINAGIGTDSYYRGTVDINRRVSDLVAVRLNAMIHHNDVPGRDVERNKRWGIAPSLTIGIDSPTRLTLEYLHQEDNNIPQYGVPYYVTATNAGPVSGIDRSSYYGYRNVDEQRVNVDVMTAIFEHDFSDAVSVRNLSRWQDVRQTSIVDPPQGTYCLSSGLTPTGAACTTTLTATGLPTLTVTVPAGYYLPSGPRGNTRISRNQLMFNQTDITAHFNTGAIEHSIDLGFAATWEKFDLSTGNVLRNANGTSPYVYSTAYPTNTAHLPYINIANPNEVVTGPALAGAVYGSNVYTGPINYIESARQDGELHNYAAYLFDTMTFGKFELNAGARIERNSGFYRADTVSTATATLGQVTRGARFNNAETLFSYRIGLVFKPVEAVSLYVAYGNSETPSKSSVSGSCTAATCNVRPETARNYEIGAKAELFDGNLLATIALFRNDRDSYKVASNDPVVPEQQLDGHSRVDGIALGLVGRITPEWTVTANYTYLDSELRQSVSNYCLANPGATGCLNSVAVPDPARGARLANTPRHSGSLFTTYTLPFGLTVGYGVTYQGSFVFGTPTLAAPAVMRSDDYWVHQAYLSYAFTPNISAQLNVKNLTDANYYTRIRNNGWATPGDARSAVLTLNVQL